MDIKPIRNKWKGTMTDRERFLNQMNYKPVDRCFNMEFGYWEENFELWDLFTENKITNNSDADVFFNFDQIYTIGGKTWMNPPFERKVIEERESSLIIQDRDGLTAEVPKDFHETIPHFLGSPITTPDDWKIIKEERFIIKDESRLPDISALKKDFENRDCALGVDCGSMIGKIRDLLTFEGLAYACFDYPDMVEDMVETCCQIVEYQLDAILPEIEFDYGAGWEDICFKNGPIVSVDFFKEVVMPRYKRISKKLRDHGIDIFYMDCDGDVRPILPYFLEGGVNCLFPYEVNGCAHPAELLNEYGKELRIMGGVNKMEMAKGPEAIKAYLETLVPLVERGGYIPFCDHRCPPDVSPENYIYYLNLKEEMFGMK